MHADDYLLSLGSSENQELIISHSRGNNKKQLEFMFISDMDSFHKLQNVFSHVCSLGVFFQVFLPF